MKTAISIPDDLAARVDAAAAARGVSRSRFYAEAAERHLAAMARDDLTGAIDRAVDLLGSVLEEESAPLRSLARAALEGVDDQDGSAW